MDHLFDEFSKSLAEPLPRRESLRRLGAVFAGAVLSPLAAGTAWAAGKPAQDPCKAFCKCRTKSQQDACLAACNACNKDTSRLAGSCGTYVCCGGVWPTRCSGRCADLFIDEENCGACGNVCPAGTICCFGGCVDAESDFYNCGTCGHRCEARQYAFGACVAGTCVYDCFEGAIDCNGTCAFLESDPDNC